MGLEQVIDEVRRDGESRAQAILADARKEADALVAAATEKANAYQAERQAQLAKDADMVRAQVASGAEFEARKILLNEENALRDELRAKLVQDFAALPAKTRESHLKKLLKQAKADVPKGKVWGASSDEKVLKDQSTYEYAGTADIAGGIIVESADGTERLDLSYETLLGDLWRDILRQEAALFA